MIPGGCRVEKSYTGILKRETPGFYGHFVACRNALLVVDSGE
jgi:hypothetical protein